MESSHKTDSANYVGTRGCSDANTKKVSVTRNVKLRHLSSKRPANRQLSQEMLTRKPKRIPPIKTRAKAKAKAQEAKAKAKTVEIRIASTH